MSFTGRDDCARRSLLLALVTGCVLQYGPVALAQAPRVAERPPARGSAGKAAPSKSASAQAADIHASPQKVFEAYRAATNKKDWRTVYECYSPEVRQKMPFEIL